MTAKNKQSQPAPATAAVEPSVSTKPASVTISSQELDDLKANAAKAGENWDKFLRTAAELDNYRKRVAREKEELARFTSERVVAALLPVLDNLERALTAAEKHETSNDAMLDGLKQIQAQFRRTLVEFGLQEVIANAGHPFDPNVHEAVGHVESADHADGHVVEQLQRGYKLADRLLRPARVVVSKGSPTSEDGSGETQDSERKAQS